MCLLWEHCDRTCVQVWLWSASFFGWLVCLALAMHWFRTLVRSGCYNRTHRLGDLKTAEICFSVGRNLLLIWEVWGQGADRLGVRWDPTSWFIDGSLLAASSWGKKGKETLRFSLIGHKSHLWGFCLHIFITFQSLHFQIPSHCGLGFNICIMKRQKHPTHCKAIPEG